MLTRTTDATWATPTSEVDPSMPTAAGQPSAATAACIGVTDGIRGPSGEWTTAPWRQQPAEVAPTAVWRNEMS